MNCLKLMSAFLLLCYAQVGLSQCPPGDLILQNQLQVDYFVSQCSNTDTIEGSLVIGDTNSTITDLSAMSFLKVILGSISIQKNAQLLTLNGLENIHSIDGLLSITDNDSLQDLSGLSGITTIQGEFFIHNNASLQTLNGVDQLHSIGGDVILSQNNSLIDISGLSNITVLYKSLRIHNNPLLEHFIGLGQLNYIAEDLSIQTNTGLANLNGLNALDSIGRDLTIAYNTSLLNLNDLQNLKIVGAGMFIGSNENLADCQGLCQLINTSGVNGVIGIGDNAGDCINNSVVLPNCLALPSVEIAEQQIKVNPNPAHTILYLTLPSNLMILSTKVYTLSGKCVSLKLLGRKSLDVSILDNGLYLLVIQTETGILHQKFVVNHP